MQARRNPGRGTGRRRVAIAIKLGRIAGRRQDERIDPGLVHCLQIGLAHALFVRFELADDRIVGWIGACSAANNPVSCSG